MASALCLVSVIYFSFGRSDDPTLVHGSDRICQYDFATARSGSFATVPKRRPINPFPLCPIATDLCGTIKNRDVPDSVLIRDWKDTACGAVARPMRYFDLAAKVVGPPGRGR